MIPVIFLLLESPEDAEFLNRLYTDFERLMYATAGKFTASQPDKEDIVQDTLVKMAKYISSLRKLDRCALPSAVVILTKSTAINFARHQNVVRRHSIRTDRDPDDILLPLPDAVSVEEMVALSEHRDGLRRIWPKLSKTDRFLLEGKYILGLDDAELAGYVGCKPGSIRMKLTRARRSALAELKRIDFCYDPS